MADDTMRSSEQAVMTTASFWDSDRKVALLLFAAALLLYLPGIWWGLPHATTPSRIFAWGSDELAPLGPVAELYSVFTHSPKFNPQYPLLQYLVEAVLVGPYMVFLWLTGGLTAPSVTYPYGLSDPVTALAVMALLARCANLLMAAGVVVVTFKTATLLWDRKTGLIAGVLVLLIYPMFYFARTSNVDMGALFWTSLGLAVFAVSLMDTLTVRRAAWLGVFAALATATKDPSYAAFLPLALVIVPRHFVQQRRQGIGWMQAWKAPLAALASTIGVYLVASGLVFHPERFRGHLEFITRTGHYASANELFYYSTPATLAGYLSVAGDTLGYLADAMGLPMLVCALAGLVLCAIRRPRLLALALPGLGILLGVILPVRFVLFRFVFVIAYVLVFFAAYALASATSAQPSLVRRAAPFLLAVVCGWALLRGADLTYQMMYDARYEAADWFRQYARAGDEIGYYGASLKLPPLDEAVVSNPIPGQLSPLKLGPDEQPAIHPEFIVVIPQQEHQLVHEWSLREADYQALRSGATGYQLALGIQTPSLFSRRIISFVNPPVRVFVRKDHLEQLPDLQPRIDIAIDPAE